MNRASRPSLSRISGSSYASRVMSRAGDGSTLSLDFTTGVLDPRLTFTRGSNATFINSSGYVEWAAANIFYNSTWTDANNTPTLWSVGSGTASRSGETRTFTTSASQTYITQTRDTASGIRYYASVEVTAVTGTQRVDDVVVALGGSSYQYYLNGSAVAGTTSLTTGVVGVAFTAGAATTAVRVGSGVQGTNTTGSVTIRFPQLEPTFVPFVSGNQSPQIIRTYRPNDSTTASYQAPRFDYDPTTLAPRGLLIEASATNLMCWSESFAQSGGTNNWQTRENVTLGTLTTSPHNSTNAYPINETTTNGVHRLTTYFTAGLSGAYSLSVWAKCVDSGTPRRLYVNAVTALGVGALFDLTASGDSGTAVNVAGSAGNRAGTWVKYPNGWYRCTVVGTRVTDASMYLQINRASSSTASDDSFAGSISNGIIMWGSMLEAGSGASSYIPTGASTGNRQADECSMTGTNFSSWFNATEGTILAHARRIRTSDTGRIVSANDNTANESFDVAADTTGKFIVTDGGSALATISPGTVTANTAFKIAGAFNLNDVQAALGGTLGTQDTSVTMPTVTQLMIGRQAGASPVYLNGTVSLVKFWPTRLPDATLQSLTT